MAPNICIDKSLDLTVPGVRRSFHGSVLDKWIPSDDFFHPASFVFSLLLFAVEE